MSVSICANYICSLTIYSNIPVPVIIYSIQMPFYICGDQSLSSSSLLLSYPSDEEQSLSDFFSSLSEDLSCMSAKISTIYLAVLGHKTNVAEGFRLYQ